MGRTSTEAQVPQGSALAPMVAAGVDFADAWTARVERPAVPAEALVAAFFGAVPDWASGLFQLRNALVAGLGLKTGEGSSRSTEPPYEVGRRIGLFRVIALGADEVILGEDDRHLDFRVSLHVAPDGAGTRLSVSTVVVMKSLLGRAYFAVVRPFHRLIVQATVAAMARQLERAGG